MDCGDRLLAQQLCFASGDLQMMQQVGLHVFELQAFQVSSAQYPGSKRPGGMIQQFVDEGGLSAEHHGGEALGVEGQLNEGMQLGEDLGIPATNTVASVG